jgi:thiazole synthase
MDSLCIGGRHFSSRLFLGSAGYPNNHTLLSAVEASGTELVTVALRRINMANPMGEDLCSLLRDRVALLPNTSGCHTTKEALLTAELARDLLGTTWIKLEIIGDRTLLYPDNAELIKATDTLVREGFTVLPYCGDDPVVCRRLADVGAAAVMPLGSPIGSGYGLANPPMLARICTEGQVPVILDAGIGSASDAVLAMELGCSAVLTNTAIAKAYDPVRMARALKCGVEAGYLAARSGRIPKHFSAQASSPQFGLVGS